MSNIVADFMIEYPKVNIYAHAADRTVDIVGEIVMPLTPRLVGDDMMGLRTAAIKGLGVVALPGYVCRAVVQSGALKRILPDWLAGDSTLTALIPYRQGLLPLVRVFLDHLAREFPKAVLL